ncbi:hypothetical protein V8F06_006899 [Rhypophila decipiens]
MADEVAEDYRQALEDLSINSRLEISTLTNIARENADFGHAIADVLEKHIKKVPAQRTLPALYVLDSIVKNVPTPYALYFGPRLYSIFMGAYTKVDNPTRKKMDEMLRTWKEPVPGSISTKPVFPPEIVRNIENALIGARTAALQAQQNSFLGQQQLRRRGPPPGAVPNRDTPTPPNMRSPYPGPNGQGPPPTDPSRNQPYPMRPLMTHTPPTGPPYHQRDIYGAPRAPEVNLERLRDDIQQLIVAQTAEFARDPHDASKQTRLRAFLELQTVIQRPDVTREQLMLVRDQVAAELAVKHNMRHGVHHPPPPLVNQYPPAAVPYAAPLVMLPQQQQQQTRTPVPQVPVAPPPAVSLDSILGQGALATLLGGLRNQAGSVPPSASATPQPVPLPLAVPPAAAAPVRSTPPVPAAQPPKDPNALLAMLRQSGILSAANTPTPPPPPEAVPTPPQPIPAVPTPVPAPTPVIPPPAPASSSGGGISLASLGLGGLSSLLPQLQQRSQAVPPPFNDQSIYLKRYMPHLLPRLHEELGSHCTQCGRRFRNDDAGRRLKAAHMDWHFRVHQRIADAEKRGQHKSWYVGEMDWIRGREAVDVDYIAPGGGGGINSSSSGGGGKGSGEEGSTSSGDGEESESDSGSDNDIGGALRRRNAAKAKKTAAAVTKGKNKKKGKKGEYFPVPDGAERVTLSICPICQESFEMKWLDEEWVWMDAVKVGDRVYHASCHREAASSGGGGGAAGANNGKRSTPERAASGSSASAVLGKRKAEVCSFLFLLSPVTTTTKGSKKLRVTWLDLC